MIHDLLNADELTSSKCRLVRDLAVLVAAGLKVVPTVVLPIECFQAWQDSGRVNDAVVDQLLVWSGANSINADSTLMIRASLIREYYGLLDNVSAKPNFAEIRSGIDRIYRSWGDDGARASRLVCNIDESESKPSLIVQALASKAYTVETRHGINGSLTNSTDYEQNINNRMPRFSRDIDRMIRTCDTRLRRPVRIDFTSDDECNDLAIISVSDEEMTTEGRIRALGDLLDREIIDEVQFLTAISPDMIGFARGIELDPAKASYYVQGLPASPGYAFGQIVFRGVQLPSSGINALIFLADEYFPEDIYFLEKCSGVIETRGGMTSHSAVICRGMHKPAVVRCDGNVDLRNRVYKTVNGQVLKEFTTALVDGQSGSVGFSEASDAGIKPRWVMGEQGKDIISKVLDCCGRLPYPEFKKLTVKTQLHIAELKRRMREMSLLDD
jgi:phosphohistidine swiveling domain-containing protein